MHRVIFDLYYVSQQSARELPVMFLLFLKNISEFGEKISLVRPRIHVYAKYFIFLLLVTL